MKPEQETACMWNCVTVHTCIGVSPLPTFSSNLRCLSPGISGCYQIKKNGKHQQHKNARQEKNSQRLPANVQQFTERFLHFTAWRTPSYSFIHVTFAQRTQCPEKVQSNENRCLLHARSIAILCVEFVENSLHVERVPVIQPLLHYFLCQHQNQCDQTNSLLIYQKFNSHFKNTCCAHESQLQLCTFVWKAGTYIRFCVVLWSAKTHTKNGRDIPPPNICRRQVEVSFGAGSHVQQWIQAAAPPPFFLSVWVVHLWSWSAPSFLRPAGAPPPQTKILCEPKQIIDELRSFDFRASSRPCATPSHRRLSLRVSRATWTWRNTWPTPSSAAISSTPDSTLRGPTTNSESTSLTIGSVLCVMLAPVHKNHKSWENAVKKWMTTFSGLKCLLIANLFKVCKCAKFAGKTKSMFTRRVSAFQAPEEVKKYLAMSCPADGEMCVGSLYPGVSSRK